MNKKKAMFYLGMSISAGFIAYAAAKMDFRKAFAAMLHIHWEWLIALLVIFFASMVLRAERLRHITAPLKQVSLKSLFSATAIGFMGNMVFPMRLGELIRVVVLARREKLSNSGVAATIVVERLFDLLSLLVLAIVTFFIASPAAVSPETWGRVQGAGMAIAVVCIAAVIILVLLSNEGSAPSKALHALIARLPEKAAVKIGQVARSFRSGLKVFSHGKYLAAAALNSGGLWVAVVATNFAALPLFGIPASVEVACMLAVFVSIGVAMPSSPGFVGPFHAAVVFTLGLYGVNGDEALGLAIFLHAFMFVVVVATGLYCAWMEKLSLSQLRHMDERAP